MQALPGGDAAKRSSAELQNGVVVFDDLGLSESQQSTIEAVSE
jgi:hypothetical protein